MSIADPIFVVGLPRSGTTLMAEVLNRHPNIVIFNETLFYDFVVARQLGSVIDRSQLHDICNHLEKRVAVRISKDNATGIAFGCRFTQSEADRICSEIRKMDSSPVPVKYNRIFSRFMESVANLRNAKRWGEKTPNHIFHLDRIRADYPSVRIIHIVRDPRRFLQSYKYAWQQAGGKADARKLYHPIVTSYQWVRAVAAFVRFEAAGNKNGCITVKYEDLVSDPPRVLGAVCAFLGEELARDMMAVSGNNTSFREGRTNLSRRESAVCEWLCSEYMQRYGYIPQSKNLTGVAAFIAAVLTLPWFVLRAAPVVLEKFGGNPWRYLSARGISRSR